VGLLAVTIISALDAHHWMLGERVQGINNTLDFASRIAQSYQARVAKGELSESDAKREVLSLWDTMGLHTDVNHSPYMEATPLTRTDGGRDAFASGRMFDLSRERDGSISVLRPVAGWEWLVIARVSVEDVNSAFKELLIKYLIWALGVALLSTMWIAHTVCGVQQHMNSDHLTGLLNRKGLDKRMASALSRRGPNKRKLALFLIDLDGFKAVNDTFGHAGGDMLLKAFAARVQSVVRVTDAVARFGGDEFAVIAHGISSLAVAERIAQAIVSTASEPYFIDGHPVSCSASVGIVMRHVCGRVTQRDLFHQADAALYAAKRIGKNQYVVFNDTSSSKSPED